MRLFTYIGLVARRVWAKKGILVGSLVGATLVIALLVVVPLYESSVQAVDLRFTLSGALSRDLDTTAFSQMNQYTAEAGAVNRDIVGRAHDDWLAGWYPAVEERTLSREFVVIPTGEGTAFDWFADVAAWRDELADAQQQGLPEEEWPAPRYPRPPQEPTQVRFFTAPNVAALIVVESGELPWPVTGTPGGDDSAPLPIVLGADVAGRIGVGVGDRFFLRPFSGFAETFELVQVAAVATAVDRDDPVWGIDDPGSLAYFDQATFDAWLAPIPIDAGADLWMRQRRGFPDSGVTQRFRMPLDTEAVDLQDLEPLEGALAQFRGQVNRESGGSIPSNTFLPQLLAEFRTRSVTIGGPILAMLALVVGGALYFLVYTAALTVEREGAEIAQLKSRGASSWQTIGIHLAQSLLIVAVAVVVAPFVARALVGVTGRIPPLDDLTGRRTLDVAEVRSLRPWLIAGGLVTFVAMGVAVMPYARRGILALRALASRPAQRSVWQRYNLDLFAIALSLVVLFQLSQRGFINTSGEEVTLDPLAVIFPVLLLFTGALILLRVFPFLLRLIGWLMTKPRSMAMALPGWHLGRNPIPYGRLALLVWVTTGLGAFALTYAATLQGSFDDRAAYAAGADVRAVGAGAGYLEVAEDEIGTPVLRTSGAPRRSGRQAEALAIRPDTFSQVVAWRADFGAATPGEILSPLRPGGESPDIGVEVPVAAVALSMDGVVVPEPLAQQEIGVVRDSAHRWLVRVIDARSRVWTMAADTEWTADGWATATVDLTTGLNEEYLSPPEPPLTIHSWWVERSSRTANLVVDGSTLLVAELRAIDEGGTAAPLDLSEMTAINQLGWGPGVDADTAARTYYSQLPEGATVTESEIRASPLYRDGEAVEVTTPQRTRGNAAVPQLRRIPETLRVLLDSEAAAIAGLTVGDTSSFGIAGEIFEGELVGLLERVPTMTDARFNGRMILDLDAMNAWLNGQANWSLVGGPSRVTGPQELWVATSADDAASRRLLAQDDGVEIVTIRGSAASFSSRPVQVGLVAILFVGAATGVFLALAGVTGYVLLAVSRRAREMGVLRALGFGRSGVGATFAVEQVVVIGLGAVIGVLGGILLTMVMIPFLQLGETAAVVEPPIALTIPWASLLGYVGIVGVLLVVSVLWATRRVSVRRMSEVLREVER
jgi:hypothetical protein